jgi:hypothetical protein
MLGQSENENQRFVERGREGAEESTRMALGGRPFISTGEGKDGVEKQRA